MGNSYGTAAQQKTAHRATVGWLFENDLIALKR
jgi:hypothetical protein